MTDLLIAAFGFVVAYQAAAWLTTRLDRQGAGSGTLLAPLLLAALATLAFLIPHEIGEWSGDAHAADDFDSHLPGVPEAWVVLLLGFFAIRALFRLGVEVRTSWRLRAGRVEPDAGLASRLGRVSALLAARIAPASAPPIRIHACGEYGSPFVRGLFRPTIHLPLPMLAGLTEDQLLAVLLHETAHRDRRDPGMAAVQSLVLSVLDLGAAGRARWMRWKERAEFACDDFAAARLGSGVPVAEAIVAVLRLGARPTPAAAGPGFCAETDSAKRRVQRLLSPRRRPPAARPAWWPALAGGVLLLVVATSVCFPQIGLTLFCFFEHAVGVHCVS